MAVDRSIFPEGHPARSSFRKAYYALPLVVAGLILLSVSTSVWTSDQMLNALSFSIGLVMVGIGCAFRIWVSTYQAGYKNRHLLVDGPYSLCRNPMYFSNLLGGLGACLTTGTVTLPVLFAAAFVVHYSRVIRDEETRLRIRHGAAFDAYRANTPRLLPSFDHFSEPVERFVRAQEFSARIRFALWPTFAVALVHFVNAMHAMHLLPVLVHIW